VLVGGFGETIELFKLSINLSAPEETRLNFVSSSKVGENPSFLAVNSNGVYCVHEVSLFKGEKNGGFSFMKIDETNVIRKIQEQFSSGEDPTHLILNMERSCAYISNYSSGHFAVTKIKENGLLGSCAYIESYDSGSGVVVERQKESHPHGACFKGKFVYCVDLGADCVFHYEHGNGYEFNSPKAERTPTGPGSGPRHMVFHPRHKIAYLITELTNEIIIFKQNESNGSLAEVSRQNFLTSDLIEDGVTNYGSEIMVHPNGKYLYLSNRGNGALISYEISTEGDQLKRIETTRLVGTWPRHFNIHPSGKALLCADQFKNLIEVFYIDDYTGKLRKVQEVDCKNSPSCVIFKF